MSSVTNKGTTWELSRSAWMFWTFVPFFSFVAFLYIGLRTRQHKWTIWGVIYAVPLLLLFFSPLFVDTHAPEIDEYGELGHAVSGLLGIFSTVFDWIANVFLYFVIACVVCCISFIHALIVRKEYLVRHAVRSEYGDLTMHELRNLLEIENGVNIRGNQIARNNQPAPPGRNKDSANRVVTGDDNDTFRTR